jgi:site-specific DNA-methyltransferase (adenine-specific)
METATRSESPEWPTPRWLVDQLAAEFGPFDTDPAATRSNAKAPIFYTIDDDGLTRPWKGRVWLNPPYGTTIAAWMAKARQEVANGNADRVVCLVPARVDTRWWRDSTRSAALVRIWPGRIAFADGTQPAPFPSAIIVLGSLPGRHGTVHKNCEAPGCGRVFWPAYANRKTCSESCRKALYRARNVPDSRPKTGHRRPRLSARNGTAAGAT